MNDQPFACAEIQQRTRMLLIGNYAPDLQRSMRRFAELLHSSLQGAGIASRIWYPPVILGHLSKPNSRWFKWVAYVDKLLFAPLVLLWAQRGYGRVHVCDHSNAYYGFFVWCRQITVTCHDVIAIEASKGLIPGWMVGRLGQYLQKMISAGLAAADHVYCVSLHTQLRLLRLKLTAPERTSVAINPLDPVFSVACGAPSHVLQQVLKKVGTHYLIHVGSDLARKNRDALFHIYAHLISQSGFTDCNLLLVGPEPSLSQQALIRSLGIEQRVHVVQTLTDVDLACAYRGAVALIFPSLQEGFGWPVAEAQACGCPVFAHQAEPMPEVGGSAARYFDAGRPYDAATLIAKSDLSEMRAAGLKNAQRFGLNELAKAILR